jgi:hypothetical protein
MSDANRPLLHHEDRITLRASAQQAWDAIKNFGDIHTWHPAAVSTELLVGQNGEPLAVREFQLADGGFVISELLEYDEAGRRFKYRILKTSVPLRGYVGEMHVTPTDEGGSVVVWSTQFEGIDDGSGAEPDEAIAKEIVGEVVKTGLDNLRVLLDG